MKKHHYYPITPLLEREEPVAPVLDYTPQPDWDHEPQAHYFRCLQRWQDRDYTIFN